MEFEEVDFDIGICVEDFEHAFGRKPKNQEEWENFAHYCKNGVEAQLDWTIIMDCAKDEMKED